MADVVQMFMERMIPELEYYTEIDLFTPSEIALMVNTRRDFEYALKRRPVRKVDGMRYLAYEHDLEATRKARKEAMKVEKKSLHDFAIQKRIHFIFDRMVKKFHGDVSLWLQYIAYCKSNKSSKILSKVFSKALQLHPRQEGLWIEAANWEMTSNQNVDLARVLMQRALRINGTVSKLWHEYFRLELLFIHRLHERRNVLGLDAASTSLKSSDADMSLNTNTKDNTVVELSASKAALLSGAIPTIVYQQAISAQPQNVEFRLEFLNIVHLFPVEYTQTIRDVILSSLQFDFPLNAHAIRIQCTRFHPHTVTALPLGILRSCIEKMDTALADNNTSELRMEYVNWLLACDCSSATDKLSQLFLTWETENVMTSELLQTRLDFYTSSSQNALALTCITSLLVQETWKNQEWLWVRAMDLQSANGASSADMIVQLMQATKMCPSSLQLWKQLLQTHILSMSSVDIIQTTYQSGITCLQENGWDIVLEFHTLYLKFLFTTMSVSQLRPIVNQVLTRHVFTTSETTKTFFLHCLFMEQSVDVGSVSKIIHFLERLVNTFPTDATLWNKYLAFYSKSPKDRNRILWRATQVCPHIVDMLE